ncbi:MAG: hypothetical protein WCJ18_07845 [Planctomycetota bacterium]
MQTLVELQPTASSQAASRKTRAFCSFFLGNLRLLVQTRPSGPGAEGGTGFGLSITSTGAAFMNREVATATFRL